MNIRRTVKVAANRVSSPPDDAKLAGIGVAVQINGISYLLWALWLMTLGVCVWRMREVSLPVVDQARELHLLPTAPLVYTRQEWRAVAPASLSNDPRATQPRSSPR